MFLLGMPLQSKSPTESFDLNAYLWRLWHIKSRNRLVLCIDSGPVATAQLRSINDPGVFDRFKVGDAESTVAVKAVSFQVPEN